MTCVHATGLRRDKKSRDAASQKPQGSRPILGSMPIPFPYQSNRAVSWRYAPQKPSEKKDKVIISDLPFAKVTNITGISGVTRSGRVFVASDPLVRSKNAKGKAKVVTEETDKVSPATDEDVPAGRFTEKGEDFDGKKVCMEEANKFLWIIQQSESKVIEQLNKTSVRVSLLELLMSSEPHRALLVKVLNESHVAQDISVEGFNGIVNNITSNNYLTFAKEEI